MTDITKTSVPLTIVIGLVASAVSAGITYQVQRDKIRSETGDAVAPALAAAKAAQADAFSLRQDVRQLQHDLARGVGRCLSRDPSPSARDWAGKQALAFFEREVAEGVPPDAALRHVFESDF